VFDMRTYGRISHRVYHPVREVSIAGRIRTRTDDEWEAALVAAGVPVAAINTIDRVVAHPQVRAHGSLVAIDHPVAGRVEVVGPPARLSDTPGSITKPAPLLGQHTSEVLGARLGLDDQQLDRLAGAA